MEPPTPSPRGCRHGVDITARAQGRDESARWDPAGGVFWKRYLRTQTGLPEVTVGRTGAMEWVARRRCPGAAELRGDKG